MVMVSLRLIADPHCGPLIGPVAAKLGIIAASATVFDGCIIAK